MTAFDESKCRVLGCDKFVQILLLLSANSILYSFFINAGCKVDVPIRRQYCGKDWPARVPFIGNRRDNASLWGSVVVTIHGVCFQPMHPSKW